MQTMRRIISLFTVLIVTCNSVSVRAEISDGKDIPDKSIEYTARAQKKVTDEADKQGKNSFEEYESEKSQDADVMNSSDTATSDVAKVFDIDEVVEVAEMSGAATSNNSEAPENAEMSDTATSDGAEAPENAETSDSDKASETLDATASDSPKMSKSDEVAEMVGTALPYNPEVSESDEFAENLDMTSSDNPETSKSMKTSGGNKAKRILNVTASDNPGASKSAEVSDSDKVAEMVGTALPNNPEASDGAETSDNDEVAETFDATASDSLEALENMEAFDNDKVAEMLGTALPDNPEASDSAKLTAIEDVTEILDEDLVQRNLCAVSIPVEWDAETIACDSDDQFTSMFDFRIDPYGLIEDTDATRYGGGFVKPDARLLFRNFTGDYDFSDQSDPIMVINRGDNPALVTITAKIDKYVSALYLTLADDQGHEVPISVNDDAKITVVLPTAASEESLTYSFFIYGTCNSDGDWNDVDFDTTLTVTWTAEPLLL